MAPSGRKRARSLESHDSEIDRPARRRQQSGKRAKKHTQKDKQRSKKKRSDASDLDSDSNRSGSDSNSGEAGPGVDEEFKAAARAIARCVDMFCNVEKVIKVALYIGQEEASRNGELAEDEDDHIRRKKFLDELSPTTIARYKRGYNMLLHLAPSLKDLIGTASKKDELKDVMRAMNRVIKLTRSDDASRLKDKIGHYVAPNAAEAAISPPFYIGGSSRSHLGFNHIILARFLCPINKLHEFDINPKRTQTKLLDGGIEIRSNIYPAFCWSGNPPASDFDENDIYEGLHKGYLLERVMRHIFTGPSSALGEESRGTRAGNAELHGMTKVEAAHIAYACVQARFGITSTNRWSEKDGSFSYRRFYYHILDDIESNDDHAWKDAILRHHNVVLFRHENGRDAGSENHSDGNHDHGNPDSDPFLAKMRAQAAARASSTASGSKSSADSERRERSPTVITPPRSSPLLQREASPPASFLPQQRESSPPALSPPPPSPTPLSPVRHREVSPGPSRPKSSGLVPSGSELSDLDEDRETVTLKGKRRVQKGKKVSSDDDETNTAKDSGARKPQKQKRVSRSRKGRK